MPEDTLDQNPQDDENVQPDDNAHYDSYEEEKIDSLTGGMSGEDNDG